MGKMRFSAIKHDQWVTISDGKTERVEQVVSVHRDFIETSSGARFRCDNGIEPLPTSAFSYWRITAKHKKKPSSGSAYLA